MASVPCSPAPVWRRPLRPRSAARVSGGLLVAALVSSTLACRQEIDLRSRTRLRAPPAGTLPTVTAPRFEVLDDDAFSDGARSGTLFFHDGTLWLGPSADGRRALRYDPVGDVLGDVKFSITGDLGSGSNASGSPYPSFGTEGCHPNTDACGPDNETGPVLLNSAVIDGAETLIAVGGKAGGGLHDLYVGSLVNDVASFSFFDLGAAIGSQAKGVSFAQPHGGHLALGLRDHGAHAPHIVDLVHVRPGGVAGPGDIDDLHGNGIGGGRAIDSIRAVGDVAYAATGAVIARSDRGLDDPGWVDATPAGFGDAESLDVDGASAQPLRDRAVPAFATLDDVVAFGRNTVGGPQLWTCPRLSCGAGDWSMVSLPGERVSSLVGTGATMVLTVDDAAGAQVLISFDGRRFATLDGVDGLGTRVLATAAARLAGDAWLYALVADDDGPARLVRVLLPSADAG